MSLFFKKDKNKTNEVSNYIGNTSVHITMQKQIFELLRNKEKNDI
jgi:hypothetical protein